MGGGEAPVELSITGDEPLPDKRVEIKFNVRNTGAASARVISAELYKDGAKIQDVDISALKNLPSGDTAVLSVRTDGEPFSAGEYELKVYTDTREFTAVQGLIPVPENQRFHLSVVSAEKTSDGFKFTLQNNKYDKSDIADARIRSIWGLKDNRWQLSTLVPIGDNYDTHKEQTFSLKSGESRTFEFVPASEISAFDKLIKGLDLADVRSGDRIALAVEIDRETEWVYLTLP